MKKTIYTLFCLLSAVMLCNCSDDDPAEGPGYDPDEQELVLTQGEVTSTSFTFSVQAKDADIPYLCLYVDKATVDEVSKGDLPYYLMEQLKEQAKEAGQTAEAYIASLSFTGNLEGQKIEGLMPGELYELVAFAVSGTKAASQAECLFFQTLTVDPVDCTFTVEARTSSNQAILDVTPSVADVYYYFNVLKKSEYDGYVQGGRYAADDVLNALFQNDFQTAMAQFAPTGEITQEGLQQMLDYLFRTGQSSYAVTGLVPETEYVWLAAAFKTADLEDQFVISSASEASTGTFASSPKGGNGMTFDMDVASTQPGSAHVRITPSLADKSYIWFYEQLTAETATLTGQELATAYMDAHLDELASLTVTGTQEQDLAGLVPGARYCILAWGFEDGQATTLPVMHEFGVASDGTLTRAAAPFRPGHHALLPDAKPFKVFPVRK